MVPSDVLKLCRTLKDAGYRAWVVGGCTRDMLLGQHVHDWDLATDAHPDQVRATFRRVIPTGIQHGTVSVLLGGIAYEVTTLRGEGSYSDGRHPDKVNFVDDLEEDLLRRDFTVNAIAYDPLDRTLTDPFGGRDDLNAKRIRAVGKPRDRFDEDGLRIMRAARFVATLGFSIEPETRHAMSDMVERLRCVSQERIRDELLKTLGGVDAFCGLVMMQQTHILDEALAELLPMVGCKQNRYHAYDVWNHTIHSVQACRAEPILRLAMLLHDVGKPAVRAISDKTKDYTFYHHEVVGADIAAGICERLRLSKEQRHRVTHLVRHHLIPYEQSWSDTAVRRWVRRVGSEHVADVLEMARADAKGKGVDVSETLDGLAQLATRVRGIQEQGMAMTVRDLAIDGRLLMRELSIAPGPQVGTILAHLLEHVTDDPALNERDVLLAEAKRFLGQVQVG